MSYIYIHVIVVYLLNSILHRYLCLVPVFERKVHARGYCAHGVFECYKSMKQFTKAGFLQEAGTKRPLVIRFSTVQGSKGSKDTARDLRCLGVKFYTEEGNYDRIPSPDQPRYDEVS